MHCASLSFEARSQVTSRRCSQVGVRKELYAALEAQARGQGKSVAHLMSEAVLSFLA